MIVVEIPADLGLGWWQWRARLKRDPCVWCAIRPARRARTIEHIDPLAHDGTDDPSNIVGSCEADNSIRGDTTLLFWLLARLDAGVVGTDR